MPGEYTGKEERRKKKKREIEGEERSACLITRISKEISMQIKRLESILRHDDNCSSSSAERMYGERFSLRSLFFFKLTLF